MWLKGLNAACILSGKIACENAVPWGLWGASCMQKLLIYQIMWSGLWCLLLSMKSCIPWGRWLSNFYWLQHIGVRLCVFGVCLCITFEVTCFECFNRWDEQGLWPGLQGFFSVALYLLPWTEAWMAVFCRYFRIYSEWSDIEASTCEQCKPLLYNPIVWLPCNMQVSLLLGL